MGDNVFDKYEEVPEVDPDPEDLLIEKLEKERAKGFSKTASALLENIRREREERHARALSQLRESHPGSDLQGH